MPEPVPPSGHLIARANDHFLRHLGLDFETLAAPLDPVNPAGVPARATSVYRAIIEARQGDEASVARGVWQRQPKRADWPHVSTLAAGALRNQGKDLQLAAWLCEAQVHEHGIAALAPCLLLLHTLCERYWTDLHPQPQPEDDVDGRAHIIGWLEQKLIPALRAAPLIVADDGLTFAWTVFEQAAQSGDADGTDHSASRAALSATPTTVLTAQAASLEDALAAIGLTRHTIDARLAHAAPRLDLLAAQVSDILALVRTEIEARTPLPPAIEPHPPLPAEPSTPAPRFRDRADAYACLAAAATYLAQTEPHSPTPYLIKRAVEWGNMNTGELYQELFIRLGGQLNIFDMVNNTPLTSPPKTQAGSE